MHVHVIFQEGRHCMQYTHTCTTMHVFPFEMYNVMYCFANFIMYSSGLRQHIMYKQKCNLATCYNYYHVFVSLCQVEKGKHVATVDDVEKMKVHVCTCCILCTAHYIAWLLHINFAGVDYGTMYIESFPLYSIIIMTLCLFCTFMYSRRGPLTSKPSSMSRYHKSLSALHIRYAGTTSVNQTMYNGMKIFILPQCPAYARVSTHAGQNHE